MNSPICPICFGRRYVYSAVDESGRFTTSTGFKPCPSCLAVPPQPRPDWLVPLGIDERGDVWVLDRARKEIE